LKRAALLVGVLALVAQPAAAATPPPAPQIEHVPDGIVHVLDDYGRAWRTHDLALLGRTLTGHLASTESRGFDNASEIGFREFAVRPLTQFSGNLASARIRALYPHMEVRTYQVLVDTRIGFESKTYEEDGAFTFVRSAADTNAYDGWRIASKSDLDILGFFSPHNLWDEAPVSILAGPHFILLTHPGRVDQVRPWLAIAEKAFARASAFWPNPTEKEMVIEVPSSEAELARMTHDTANISDFVAFVAAGVNREHGFRPTGPRMFVNISHLLRYPPSAQVSVLAHELIHALTREVSGPNTPTWVEEGLADDGGGTETLLARARIDQIPTTFPPSERFVTGPVTDIQAAYAEADVAMQVLLDRFGKAGVVRFYDALGAERIVPGTERYAVGEALQESLHWSYDEWVAAWRERLR
jgi:hypothetical protein